LGCLHQIYTGLKQHNYRHLSIGWGKLSSLQTSITFFLQAEAILFNLLTYDASNSTWRKWNFKITCAIFN
jgi:hypothetical protein